MTEHEFFEATFKVGLSRLTATLNDLDRAKQITADNTILEEIENARASMLAAEQPFIRAIDRMESLKGKEEDR